MKEGKERVGGLAAATARYGAVRRALASGFGQPPLNRSGRALRGRSCATCRYLLGLGLLVDGMTTRKKDARRGAKHQVDSCGVGPGPDNQPNSVALLLPPGAKCFDCGCRTPTHSDASLAHQTSELHQEYDMAIKHPACRPARAPHLIRPAIQGQSGACSPIRPAHPSSTPGHASPKGPTTGPGAGPSPPLKAKSCCVLQCAATKWCTMANVSGPEQLLPTQTQALTLLQEHRPACFTPKRTISLAA
jgi:hypothetical protein